MRLVRHAGAVGVLQRHRQRAPYAFVDDAPLEERRTQAVQTRRAGGTGHDIGALDRSAIDRVRDEVRPDPRDADELHDALLTSGFLLDSEADRDMCLTLAAAGRATRVRPAAEARPSRAGLWVAAERLPELLAVHPDAVLEPPIQPPALRAARVWTREDALVELLRGRMSIARPGERGGACGECGCRPVRRSTPRS